MPFFFLLVDSVFESFLAFSGAESAVPLLPVVAACVVTSDGAPVPGSAFPELGAGSGVSAGAFTELAGDAALEELAFSVVDAELFAGSTALPAPDAGPSEMISAPTLEPAA
jgi:hypothetical protein